ncbi:hypothetical protein F4825DRAFT_148944 [Nemania diffusa]|nr:hypothetical protein F4825DRAFT_148944 [Nemania diffusa]
MPARSAVSLLAAPAPIPRQCLSFLYPPSALLTPLTPGSFSRSASSARRQRNGLVRADTRRPFHSTAARRDDAIDDARNHYETLKVAPNASASEIKKCVQATTTTTYPLTCSSSSQLPVPIQCPPNKPNLTPSRSFYTLSKTHHPDLHEASARRAAAKRFMRISEAYAVLSSPPKRAKYDREHMGLPASTASAARQASYSSTMGPAGGRPASGLSRRRGTFQGPPPSFFRSGGWGAQGEKRRAAHEDSTGTGAAASGPSASANTGMGRGRGSAGSGTVGGMGPGQDPFLHRDSAVPHFDKESHQRTGRRNDRRRDARRAASEATDEFGQAVPLGPERGVAGMFFFISSVLLFSCFGPFFVSRLWTESTRGQKPKSAAKGKD